MRLARVIHLGFVRGGTGHFWLQRVTAAANVVLVTGFVIVVLATVGRPHAEATAILGAPLNAALLVLLVISVAVHMRLGMQVVIDDYVHGERVRIVSLLANTAFAVTIGAVALIAVFRLAVGV